jgi:hypothetical protein
MIKGPEGDPVQPVGPIECAAALPRLLQERLTGQEAGQTVRPLRGRTDRKRYSDRERRRPPARSQSVMGLGAQSITERDHKSVQDHQIRWSCSRGEI